MTPTMSTQRSEPKSGLVALVAAPIAWAAHFLLSYVTVAIWCAKVAGADRSLDGARLVIALYTAAALVAIAVIGWRALGHHRSSLSVPEDRDTPEARQRFVTFATLLLAGLAAIAIIYVALAVTLV